MGLELITPPNDTPISLAEAKAYLRVVSDSEDDDVQAVLDYAVDFVQRETRQQLVTATFRLSLDYLPSHEASGCHVRDRWGLPFDGTVVIPAPPLVSVESVQYVSGGTLLTLSTSAYTVDVASKPGRVVLKSTATLPTLDVVPNALQVNFTAGYGDASAVPPMLKQAVRWLVGHAFENREAIFAGVVGETPLGVKSILEAHTFREAI